MGSQGGHQEGHQEGMPRGPPRGMPRGKPRGPPRGPKGPSGGGPRGIGRGAPNAAKLQALNAKNAGGGEVQAPAGESKKIAKLTKELNDAKSKLKEKEGGLEGIKGRKYKDEKRNK